VLLFTCGGSGAVMAGEPGSNLRQHRMTMNCYDVASGSLVIRALRQFTTLWSAP
jgi:hypothetical protein